MSGGRVAVLIGLALLLLQCNSERLLIVSVDPGEVTQPVAQLEVRTDLDRYQQPIMFDVIDDAGRSQDGPIGIGIYHPRLTGKITVRVHALATGGRRIAGGSVDFMLTGEAVEKVEQHLKLKPCVDAATGPVSEVCQMPPPNPDGGDGGVDRNANDGGDAGDAGDADDADDGGDGSTACPGNSVPALASVDAGAITSDCETYCAAAVGHCPDLFPRLPFPTSQTGDPAPIDICRLACLASQLTAPGLNGLTCRTGRANESDGSPLLCKDASLASTACLHPDCETYCRMYETICGGQFGECFAGCKLPLGEIAVEPMGDTLSCRMVWLQRAMFDPTACGAAGLQPICGPCRSGS